MAFNTKGYLDAGLHIMEQSAMETAFVTAFPHSSTRRTIMDGYNKHFSEVQSVIATFQQFIDGSFVSNKNDPADIDLVCFIDADTVNNLPQADQQKLAALFAPSARST